MNVKKQKVSATDCTGYTTACSSKAALWLHRFLVFTKQKKPLTRKEGTVEEEKYRESNQFKKPFC